MPHLILKTPLTLAQIARRLSPLAWRGAHVNGRFIDVLHSQRADVILVDTYINEEPLSQRVGLTIRSRRRQAHELVLGVHELGFPRPTRGVHLALAALAVWMEEVAPETVALESNLQTTDVTIG